MTTTRTLKDLKEGLSSARKADITHVRLPFMIYTARPCEYGSKKYERANFIRAVSPVPGIPTKADFERYRSYLRAAASHIAFNLHEMELHQANDSDLVDVEGMKRAVFAVDTDPDVTGKVGPSYLPHIAGACASLNMVITQAVMSGLLPADPGQPWTAKSTEQVLADVRVARGAYDVIPQGGLAADLTPGPHDLLDHVGRQS